MDLSFLRKNRAVSEIWIIIKNLDSKRGSNVNEVIRAVLNSLFFFFTKKFYMHKKHKKHKDTTKQKHKTQISKQATFFFP